MVGECWQEGSGVVWGRGGRRESVSLGQGRKGGQRGDYSGEGCLKPSSLSSWC